MYILYEVKPVKKRERYKQYIVKEQSCNKSYLIEKLLWRHGHWVIRSAMGEQIMEVNNG